MSSANNSKMIVMSSIVKPELIPSNKNNSKSSIKRENISGDKTTPCRKPTAQSKKEEYELQCLTHDFTFVYTFLIIFTIFKLIPHLCNLNHSAFL